MPGVQTSREMMQQQPMEVVQEGYTLAARPLQRGGAPDLVSYSGRSFKTQGGRAFFEFLVTPEGFGVIDPDTLGRADAATCASRSFTTPQPSLSRVG